MNDAAAGVKITTLIPKAAIVMPIRATDSAGALDELSAAIARAHGLDHALVLARLRDREALASTAIGKGIALPHGRAAITHSVAALGIAPAGIAWQAPDLAPVRVAVAIVSPQTGSEHLHVLARIGGMLGDPRMFSALVAAPDPDRIAAILASEDPRV